MKRIFVLCISVLTLLSGCSEKPSNQNKELNKIFNFNEEKYQNALKERFTDESFSAFLNDSSFQYLDTLKDFYYARNFQPLFIKSFEDNIFIDSLLSILSKAEEHGLDPELYHYSFIEDQFFNAINDTMKNPGRLTQLANSELFVTDAILKYSYHMRYGVVNPKELFPDSYFIPVTDSSKRDLFEPLKQNNIIEYLQDIQPKSAKYIRLQSALTHFGFYKNLEWKIIPIPDKKIELGKSDSSITMIADRLIALGLLDTSKIKIIDFAFYDSLLINPVKKFQKINGLTEDGVIGKTTVERLNISPEDYIKKIKINLERFRWIDYSDTSRYIFVNIPDFKLFAMENGKELFNIKVCTGSKRSSNYQKQFQVYKKTKRLYNKPDDWETPCLYGEISNLVLNPAWNVPPSIMREEIFAGIKKDSSYLVKKNFKVYKNEIEINYTDVNLNDFAFENIPYRIVQDPGDGNALGKIKFMFKNPFGVYLHDTPSRHPFTYSNRAVSHGCVRVEKPLQLSEFIISDHPKWDIDFLKIEIGQKVDDKTKISEYKQKRSTLRKNSSYGKTTDVVLDKKIPLFIDYYTAWVDEDGYLNYRDDVYRKDKILIEYLFPENKLEKLISFVK